MSRIRLKCITNRFHSSVGGQLQIYYVTYCILTAIISPIEDTIACVEVHGNDSS